jgi:hypothetical protein
MAEPPREQIGGEIGGQKFHIETQHLISVLLIVVVGAIIYFLVNVQQGKIESLIDQLRDDHDAMAKSLRDDHDQMFLRMTRLANALRVLDYNQQRPAAERVPLDLPVSLFEDYRQQHTPAARRPTGTPRREDAAPQPP